MFYIKKPGKVFRKPWQSFGGILLVLLLCCGCGGTSDDLLPSGEDKRPVEVYDDTGNPINSNISPDFALITTDNTTFVLSDYLRDGANEVEAIVLYFTMWCPICSGHMDQIQFQIMPKFSGANVVYLAIDYLSSSTEITRQSQQEAGFTGAGWLAAADAGQVVTGIFEATMGTTVVIDPDGVIRMNEDFRTGENLQLILEELTGVTP